MHRPNYICLSQSVTSELGYAFTIVFPNHLLLNQNFLSVSKVASCLRQVWTVSKINTGTFPSLYAELFEITQLEGQHWTTSIQKKLKKLKAWQFNC